MGVPGALAVDAQDVQALDTYEGPGRDDTPGTARDITAYFAANAHWFGSTPRDEWHYFDFVEDETTTTPPASDEDWVKFTFDSTAYTSGYSYLFEAVAVDPLVDPVIEIYGPNAADPTAPGDLVASSETPRVTELDPEAVDANDDGPWFADRSASVSFMPDAVGTYFVRVRPYYQYDNGEDEPGFRNGTGRYRLKFKVGQTSRVSGATRVATAIAVSKERFPSFGPEGRAAVLANAYSFPDALSGSTLAGAVGGPILLTPGTALAAEVRDEIDRLDVETVYILGGTAAVSSAVSVAVDAIQVTTTQTVDVVRLPGTNRSDTARLVALEAAKVTETAPVAFVANYRLFPDALAASPMAAHNVAPVLLTPGNSIDSATLAALNDPALGITDVVIVGGTSVISNTVQNQIASALGGSTHVRRIGGSSRYATARDFAIWATGWKAGPNPATHVEQVGTAANPTALDALDFNRIGLASGENFPDALAGGAFCGQAEAPILLTKPGVLSPYVLDYLDVSPIGSRSDYYGAAPYAFERCYVFGGPSAVYDSVFRLWDIYTGPGPF